MGCSNFSFVPLAKSVTGFDNVDAMKYISIFHFIENLILCQIRCLVGGSDYIFEHLPLRNSHLRQKMAPQRMTRLVRQATSELTVSIFAATNCFELIRQVYMYVLAVIYLQYDFLFCLRNE